MGFRTRLCGARVPIVNRILPVLVFMIITVFPTLAWGQSEDVESSSAEASSATVPLTGLELKGYIECRRAFGLVGGFVNIGGSWEFVGKGPIALTGSPVFSMMCDTGGNKAAFSLGIETAPFYVQRSLVGQTATEQWITASFGAIFGNQKWQYGALASVGYAYFGAGFRAELVCFHSKTMGIVFGIVFGE